jgi:SNF2 family DNA or RNA helicase
MDDIREVKLIHRTAGGTLVRSATTLRFADGRIEFLKSPFALKDEIKAMAGAKWHGYEADNPRQIWSIADCQRNRFQLGYLMGDDVYAWFDRQVEKHDYTRPLMPHQKDLSDHFLTYHYGIMAAEMGVGKTLAVQEVMERSGIQQWWWIGPKTSLPNIRREFRRWNLDPALHVEMMNYEALVRIVDEWEPATPVPQGVVADESSRLKGSTSQRSNAMQRLADMVRATHGFDGYVIEMSGTPSPKSPLDWWSQCEIAWPGFLKEGSPKALEERLAFLVNHQYDAGMFKKRVGWKDDERKCRHCGQFEEDGPHSLEDNPADYHHYEPSFNEVAYLHERLKGLVIIKHKKDCLDLPEKRYRRILCRPNASTLRAAQALAQSAPNTITGLTWLRELSDGFQYREATDGTIRCPHCPQAKGVVEEWFDPADETRTFQTVDMLDKALVARLQKRAVPCPRCGGKGEVPRTVRVTKEVPCPKDKALRGLLDECEETGRIVVFAGFTGSIDHIVNLCLREKWDVVRCDQGEFQVFAAKTDGSGGRILAKEDPLDYWSNLEEHPRVAFVAHPESGGMSLTLTESRMAVYWSNSFKPEYRTQSEDRIHRLGMDLNKGCVIVDLLHLPTDQKVLDVIRENRKLELMTMGEIVGDIDWSETADECEPLVEILA